MKIYPILLYIVMPSSRSLSQLIVMRHGESIWNRQKKWAGWSDIPLSQSGIEQAKYAAHILQSYTQTLVFDEIYVSSLQRTKQTAVTIINQLGLQPKRIPIVSTWRLNQKHYGKLQGAIKKQAVKQFGEQLVNIWRRSLDIPPPEVNIQDSRYPGNDPKYHDIAIQDLPRSQSLFDVYNRFLPLWENQLRNKIQQGKRIFIIGHGSSIRSLNMAIMKDKSKQEISKIQVPNAMPILYNLNSKLLAEEVIPLGDSNQIKKKIQKIKKQTNLTK